MTYDLIIVGGGPAGSAAADAGTEIHASIEAFYLGQDKGHIPYVKGAVDAILESFGPQAWIPERSFSHELGYGGKVDLHCPTIVLDVKTKEFTDKVEAFDDHIMQLAAYRAGLGIPNARCANVFVSVTVPGLVVVKEWTQAELVRGWEMFNALRMFWFAKSGLEIKA